MLQDQSTLLETPWWTRIFIFPDFDCRISHQRLQRSGVQLCPPFLITKKTCLLVSCLPSKALLMLQQCNCKDHFSISVSELNRKYIRNSNLLTRSFLELQLQGGTTHLTKHLDFLLEVGQAARDRIIRVVEAQTLTGQATHKVYTGNTMESTTFHCMFLRPWLAKIAADYWHSQAILLHKKKKFLVNRMYRSCSANHVSWATSKPIQFWLSRNENFSSQICRDAVCHCTQIFKDDHVMIFHVNSAEHNTVEIILSHAYNSQDS